jgi:L-threonylcarbamoyladenylate synthase
MPYVEVINSGGTILYPTDTIWGIGCHPFHAEAIDAVFKLKNRPREKNFILLVSGMEMLEQYVDFLPSATMQFLNECQNPTTAIYKNVKNLPDYLLGEDGSVAIRMIQHPYITPLIDLLKVPLISTSANISGQDAPKNFTDIDASILNGVDAVFPLEMDVCGQEKPSSIVEILEDGAVRWIRK